MTTHTTFTRITWKSWYQKDKPLCIARCCWLCACTFSAFAWCVTDHAHMHVVSTSSVWYLSSDSSPCTTVRSYSTPRVHGVYAQVWWTIIETRLLPEASSATGKRQLTDRWSAVETGRPGCRTRGLRLSITRWRCRWSLPSDRPQCMHEARRHRCCLYSSGCSLGSACIGAMTYCDRTLPLASPPPRFCHVTFCAHSTSPGWLQHIMQLQWPCHHTVIIFLYFTVTRDSGAVVASAGPCASHLHLAPDRQPSKHLFAQFFTGRMLFLPPNHQCQSTEGKTINDK